MNKSNDPLIEFGRRVRECREALRDGQGKPFSQERFADHVGFHRTYIGNIERGRVNVALRNIVIIAEGLQIDPAELMRSLHT